MNHRFHLFVDFRGDVLGDGGEGGVGGGVCGASPADEPVGDVDVGGMVFGGGVALEKVGDFNVELREGGEFLLPSVVAVGVGEGGDFAAVEDVEAFVELGFAAGGEPDELGHEAGADDGGFFGFDEANGFVGMSGEEVFSEEALGEGPVRRELAGVFHEGVYPGDFVECAGVFDAVAGVGVVFHDFTGADAASGVYLKEDDGAVPGDAEAVVVDDVFEDEGIEDGGEESGEVGMAAGADGAGDDVFGEGVHLVHRCTGVDRMDGVDAGRFGFGVVLEVLPGCVVVAAGGFVVASAYGLGEGFSGFVDVTCEAAFAAAGGTSVAGGGAGVFLEGVFILHRFCRFW